MVPLSFGCGSAVFAAIAMLAPSRAARNAIASPMPRLPPDMNSVLPLSDVMSPPCGVFRSPLPLLPRRLRPTGTRIRGAEQSLLGYRYRIGRSQGERFDHAMAFGPQRSKRVVGETAFDPHLIRQPLMVHARRRHRGRDIHAIVEHVDDHLQHRRDDAAAAG